MNEPETCVCFVFFFFLLLALRKADHSRDKHRFTAIEFVFFFYVANATEFVADLLADFFLFCFLSLLLFSFFFFGVT